MISSASLAKSSTIAPCLPGWVRLRRESVCTAFTPPSFLSTYIVCSSGWSKPVWNLLATTRKRYSGFSNSAAVCRSLTTWSCPAEFMLDSVYDSPPSFTVPEKATSAFQGWPFAAR